MTFADLSRFSTIKTATLGHLLTEGFMVPGIQALNPGFHICGPALTVRLPGADASALIDALSMAEKGEVLVIDRCGDLRHACFGTVTAHAAMQRGIAGVILDGFVKDQAAIAKIGLPVWCRGKSPLVTRNSGFSGEIGGLISCGGARVARGDLILADDSGVVVLDPARASELARAAEDLQESELRMISRLLEGESLRQVVDGLPSGEVVWQPRLKPRSQQRK